MLFDIATVVTISSRLCPRTPTRRKWSKKHTDVLPLKPLQHQGIS